MIPRTEYLTYEGKLECGCTISHKIMMGVGSATTLAATADIMRSWREQHIGQHACQRVTADNPTGFVPPDLFPGGHHAG